MRQPDPPTSPLRGPADHGEWLRAVFAEHERPLLACCVRLVGDAETARDVVQDAFLRLISQQRAEVEDHVAEWLYTVCRNRALDVLRKERRMTELSDERQRGIAGGAEPAGEEQAEQSRAIQQLLDALPPRQQEVIRLKFLGGLSYKEISRITELTVSNVGFLIHTGLKTVREQLATMRQRVDAESAATGKQGVAG